MKLCLRAAMAVLFLGLALTTWAKPNLEVVTPTMRGWMTSEEVAWMVEQVELAFPKALVRVSEVFGTGKTDRIFKKFFVSICDVRDSDPGLHGRSSRRAWKTRGHAGKWQDPYFKTRQNITLYAQRT